jgi:acid phosphatase family membrane protein YuiD
MPSVPWVVDWSWFVQILSLYSTIKLRRLFPMAKSGGTTLPGTTPSCPSGHLALIDAPRQSMNHIYGLYHDMFIFASISAFAIWT